MPIREGGAAEPLARSANVIWRNRVEAFAERPAFHFRGGDAWQSLTWHQADQQAREIGAGLCALGLPPGARVAMLCQTRVEWVLCDVAMALTGLVSVPIYPSSTNDQCAFVVEDSGASAVVVENREQLDKLSALAERRPEMRFVVVDPEGVPPDPSDPMDRPTTMTLATLRQRGQRWMAQNPGQIDELADKVGPEDSFTIIYTSGTTGQPKGVVLTHHNLVSSCASAVRAFDLRTSDLQYLFLPLAHVLGREVEWAPMIVGAQVAFAASPARIKYDLVEIRPTFMAGVPRVFDKLYAAIQGGAEQGSKGRRALVRWAFAVAARWSLAVSARNKVPRGLRLRRALADAIVLAKLRRRLGLQRCRFLISGGAPLAPEVAQFFHGIGLLILEGYGLTETTAAAFVNRSGNFRFGTVGPAIDVIDWRLASDGEILLRGASVFGSYHANPEATAEVFDGEGWFHTGDIGVEDDGFLRIVDRKKDIIITAGGKNVAPQKLENALKAHCQLVNQVVVFGDKRSHCVALVTPSESAIRAYGSTVAGAADSPELKRAVAKAIDDVNAALASYETIKSFAILPADFSEATGELTPSLKVKRDVVATKFAHVLAGLYGLPPAGRQQ